MVALFELPESPRDLDGTVTAFEDIVALEAYEDHLTSVYVPPEFEKISDTARILWTGREPLRQVLTPSKFNGLIGNIVATHFEDPYQELIEAHIWASRPALTNEAWFREHITLGADLVGDLISTGQGTIGSFATKLWLYPRHPDTANINQLGAFNRAITKLKKSDDTVQALIEASSERGRRELVKALRRPYSAGLVARNRSH